MGARRIKELFEDGSDPLSVPDWVARNLALYDVLAERGLVELGLVSREAHAFLTRSLIHPQNPAAIDPLNAGHVRAQNENLLLYALELRASPETLTIGLSAGFIHDLNKSIGEPLRRDRYAVRDAQGQRVERTDTLAESVGLNHLGQRTRAALEAAGALPSGALAPEVLERIDECIVHHGLGSSSFIRQLLEGDNAWWGAEFVDRASGLRLRIHPPAPTLSLESLLHDLADSTQQMQGGAAWYHKYPQGFWSQTGHSLAFAFSAPPDGRLGGIPLSLRQQVQAESATCYALIAEGRRRGLIDAAGLESLRATVAQAAEDSERWVDDAPEHLGRAGESVYHDLGRALRITPEAAQARLATVALGSSEAQALEPLILASAAQVDRARSVRLLTRLALRRR